MITVLILSTEVSAMTKLWVHFDKLSSVGIAFRLPAGVLPRACLNSAENQQQFKEKLTHRARSCQIISPDGWNLFTLLLKKKKKREKSQQISLEAHLLNPTAAANTSLDLGEV